MPNRIPAWPPSEGDAVRVRDAGLVGTVTHTKGVHERRFRVKLLPWAAAEDAGDLKTARRSARRASRWYSLYELGPPS